MESLLAPNICANCGKSEEESDNLKTCTACRLVKYCSRDCQIAHRSQHKKACKKRAAELHDEKLFKEIEKDDCPICFQPMPIDSGERSFKPCCGKNICNGCIHAMEMREGKKLCAFCRTPPPSSDQECVKLIKKLMDKENAMAFNVLGFLYAHGRRGVPQDMTKANELYLKAGELGYAGAYYNLGMSYDLGRGVEVNMKKAKHYYELAAMGGDPMARHNVGCMEWNKGNYDRAHKHHIISARAGFKECLDKVKKGFKMGMVSKDEFASTLRAYHERQKEMKSEERDQAAASGWYTNG